MVSSGRTAPEDEQHLGQLAWPVIFFLVIPMVMIGAPALWEVVLCLALLAAKIFRIGILMTGKRFSIGEVARWLRYRG